MILRAFGILAVILIACPLWAADPKPVRLIFDTDIMGDVDDVGTVALLHALASRGEVQILAMGVSAKNPWCPLCLDALNGLKDRQSWDQTAVLYAVRGLNGGLAGYWDLRSGGRVAVADDGSNAWRDTPDQQHSYLVKRMSPDKIASVIEGFMLESPTGDAKRQ